jgi:hypothetical protein
MEKVGGLEELLSSLEMLPYLDPAKLSSYLVCYGKQVLYQKTGYLLSQFNQTLRLPESFFAECEAHVGKSVRYLDQDLPDADKAYDRRWRLVVPRRPITVLTQGVNRRAQLRQGRPRSASSRAWIHPRHLGEGGAPERDSRLHELRSAARDLYDIDHMVQAGLFADQEDLLRRCVVFYLAVGTDEVPDPTDLSRIQALTPRRIRTDLQPVLRKRDWFDLTAAQQRVTNYLGSLLRLEPPEQEFLHAFQDGHWKPELIFEDEQLTRVAQHPMAQWKLKHS